MEKGLNCFFNILFDNKLQEILKLILFESFSFLHSLGKLEYTDDTAMARCVAESLIANNGQLEAKDLAKRLVFFWPPKKGGNSQQS